VDGRTLVPVRGVFEQLGFIVSWYENPQTVILSRDCESLPAGMHEIVIIRIGRDTFSVGVSGEHSPPQERHTLDVPAQIINGRTMLPIRAVLEAVGYSVEWHRLTRTIAITTALSSDYTMLPSPVPPRITFDPQGGIVEPTTQVTSGSWSGVLTSIPTPTRAGFAFVGWFSEPEGGEQIATSTVFDTCTTIYARWTSESTAVTAEDFVLTISVEETTLAQGEDFRVTAELKNNSGEDIEIFFCSLAYPIISGWQLPIEMGAEESFEFGVTFFPKNSTMQIYAIQGVGATWHIGHTLEPGTHELRFIARFSLDEQEEQITIWSNAIILTVQ
jgi:uncharacterized repeat protein (TIGR02543 family)